MSDEVCEYALPVIYEECGRPAVAMVSARHGACCEWRTFAACREHESALYDDLNVIFEVTVPYDIGDETARAREEAAAEALSVPAWDEDAS